MKANSGGFVWNDMGVMEYFEPSSRITLPGDISGEDSVSSLERLCKKQGEVCR